VLGDRRCGIAGNLRRTRPLDVANGRSRIRVARRLNGRAEQTGEQSDESTFLHATSADEAPASAQARQHPRAGDRVRRLRLACNGNRGAGSPEARENRPARRALELARRNPCSRFLSGGDL